MGKIQYSTDYRIFFPPNDPVVKQLDEVHEQFWKSDTLLFVIKNPTGDIFSKRDLTAIHELTTSAWQLPYSYRVDSLANYQHIYGENDSIHIVDLFRDPENLTEKEIENIRKIGLNEIDLVKQLVSEDGSTLGVLVTLQFPPETMTAAYEATVAAREMKEAFLEKYPDLIVKLTGLAVVETAYLEVSQEDLATLTPAMYAVILIAFAFMFWHLGAILVILFTITIATLATMGFSGWLGIEATTLTGLLPTIVLVIAVADIVHIMTAMKTLTGTVNTQMDLVKAAITKTLKPILATTITTSIGFLSLAFAASPPYQDFGILAAIGSLLAFISTLAIAPVLLPFIKFKQKSIATQEFASAIISPLLMKPKSWILVFLVTIIAISWIASKNEINDRIVENFDTSIPVRDATEFAFDNLTGIYRLEYIAKATDSDITNPEYLAELDKFAHWLRSQSEVSSVSVVTDAIKKLQRAMHNGDQEMYTLPSDADKSAQMLLVYEMSLPFGMDLSNQVNIQKSATRLIVTLGKLDTKQIRAFKKRADDWWIANSRKEFLHASAGTGETIVFANLTHVSIEYMVYGVGFALLLVTAFISLLLRDMPLGVMSLLPNLLPFCLLFGIWYFISAEINTAAANICVVVYGLFVDATIHLIFEFKEQIRIQKNDTRTAIVNAYRNVLPAIFVNSIILTFGFAVLTISPFTMNSDFGWLGAIGIACAFVLDLLLLPILLLLFQETFRRQHIKVPVRVSESV